MEVLFYKNGVCLDMGKRVLDDLDEELHKRGLERRKPEYHKRGKLDGKTSFASFRRLREYCITHDCDMPCWGITLTVPGLSIMPCNEFKSIVHKLGVFCNYHDIPLVWRCELQQRGQPHLHLCLYGDCYEVVLVLRQWQKLLQKTPKVFNVERCGDEDEFVEIDRAFCHGSQHMFDVQRLNGDFRSWRYLVSHASKAKKVQLGWAGRQWGVVCRDRIPESASNVIELDQRIMFVLRRWVRRYSYRRIGNFGKHFVLMSPKDLQRLIDYIKDDYFGSPF